MNSAETKRAEDLMIKAANNALARLRREHQMFSGWKYSELHGYVYDVFHKSIATQCAKIVNAAAVKPAVHRQIEKEQERRKSARKELADGLRAARAKLRRLEWKIQHAEKHAEKIVGEQQREQRQRWARRLLSAKTRLRQLNDITNEKSMEISAKYMNRFTDFNGYPAIPKPTYSPSATGENLPYLPGIYFLWNADSVEYVGQAKYLCNRLKIGSHHILKEAHRISFVVMNQRELTWAECYYIGICKPQLNFGRMASHYESEASLK